MGFVALKTRNYGNLDGVVKQIAYQRDFGFFAYNEADIFFQTDIF